MASIRTAWLQRWAPSQWRARLSDIRPLVEAAREALDFAGRRARDVRLAQVAGSLTFTTMLSIVPLLAVVLSLLTAFPLFTELRGTLEKTLLRGLLPDQYAVLILRYLNEFTTKAARLTALGLGFLFVTAMLMILTVDRVLNDLWQVRSRRPLVQRVLIYWTLITLGPLLVAASLSVSSYLFSMSRGLVGQLPGLLSAVLDYLPLVLSGFAYAALYVVVPARRVLWRDALIGGFAASIAGEVMKDAFGLYIRAGTVTTVYGAFAVLPLFLLWVYVSWFVVLFGAAIAATLPQLRVGRFSDERRAGNRFITAVALLCALLDAKLGGREAGRRSLEELALAVHTAPGEAEALLLELSRLDYVSRLDDGRWLLTCDPDTTDLVPVFARLAIDPGNTLLLREPALQPWLREGMNADWINRPLSQITNAA